MDVSVKQQSRAIAFCALASITQMLCRHTDILEDGTLRDNGNRNYEFVVRTIATVGNYGKFNWTPLPDALLQCHGMICAREWQYH